MTNDDSPPEYGPTPEQVAEAREFVLEWKDREGPEAAEEAEVIVAVLDAFAVVNERRMSVESVLGSFAIDIARAARCDGVVTGEELIAHVKALADELEERRGAAKRLAPACDHPSMERQKAPAHERNPHGLAYEWCTKCGGVRSVGPGHENDEWEYNGDGKNVHFRGKA